MRTWRITAGLGAVLGYVWACGFEGGLREYLTTSFWLPFAKSAHEFERPDVVRASAPFAGMTAVKGAETSLTRLRAAYQKIGTPQNGLADLTALREAVNRARADKSLTPKDREEVDLIDAKIDMRAGMPEAPGLLDSAKAKLKAFLASASTPELLSEARGWLARVHYLLGEQTEAGKIYLDELNRDGSNLGRETVLNSLAQVYGRDGGPQLIDHLEEYFDTPEHAAFAVQLVTNPGHGSEAYTKIRGLLEQRADLLQAESGANALAVLGMRAALRMGDPAGAVAIAAQVPARSDARLAPDFQWMLASAHFLSRDYAAAELPLLDLFASPEASTEQKAAAAYGLCGVYWKVGNTVEQIRFALWLRTAAQDNQMGPYNGVPVYWATSGWDLGMVLDHEASIAALEDFIQRYPRARDVRLVKYALAVRLSRENRYEDAARIYADIGAVRRAPRLRRLANLYREMNREDLLPEDRMNAKYRFAEYLSRNPDRIYFNDSLWLGYQNYALFASNDNRLTREERDRLMAAERKLRDDQEERWRAHLLLREIVRDAGKTDLGRKAARLALECLARIHTGRFGRQEEIRAASGELKTWLR